VLAGLRRLAPDPRRTLARTRCHPAQRISRIARCTTTAGARSYYCHIVQ
jgi:hypothetical protein